MMRVRYIFPTAAMFASLALCLVLDLRTASAEEQFGPFLEGLRREGLHDMAIEYLDAMQTSSLISDDLKETLSYERGITLIDSARAEFDLNARGRILDEAQRTFEEFIRSHSAHRLSASAQTQLGHVLVERGKARIEDSQRPSQFARKDTLVAAARTLFKQAEKVFSDSERSFAALEKSFPAYIPENETERIAARDQARRDLIQARLYSAAVADEAASTYEPGSAAEKKALSEAAEKFAKVYEDYRQRFAGLYAYVRQGQCFQKLGDTKRALGIFSEIAAQPDDLPEMRQLKAQALNLALQCLISDQERKYDEAVLRGRAWLDAARGAEDRSADGLAIRYQTALALRRQAEALEGRTNQATKERTLTEARDFANLVAQAPGPYQNDAKALYRELSGRAGDEAPPANFAEARDRGQTALARIQTLEGKISIADVMRNAKSVPAYRTEIENARREAVELFQLALRLKDDETTLDDLNLVRYYVCFLYYQQGHSYDAAVLGEFLARNYPNSAGARQCAKIALAVYSEKYFDPRNKDREFDNRHMVEIAEYIASRWADEPEAEEAWGVLIDVATREGRLDDAMAILEKIPAESSGRAAAELKAGQAMWSAYLVASAADEGETPPAAELNRLVGQARNLLEGGVAAAMKSEGDPTATVALAALSLAQMDLRAGRAEEAVAWLEEAKVGPLVLIEAKRPFTTEGNFAVEVYKLALRAYVAAQNLDKAEAAMQTLEGLVASQGDADADAVLTAIYISLGRALEQQVAALRQQNKTAELESISKGFELFLQKIAERKEGLTFNALNWVAETFYGLGSGLDDGTNATAAKARSYYEKSEITNQRILELARTQTDWAPADALLTVLLRSARCARRLGQYSQAIELLEGVLREKPTLLDAQREAALVYQDRGRQDARYFSLAIAGARKTADANGRESNLIWGWTQLATMVQRDKRFDEIFHEARYNVAKCRYLQAIAQSGAAKADGLKRAEFEIQLTIRLKPDRGGPAWDRKYDVLLRAIQEAAGKAVTGLTPLAAQSS